VSFIGFLQQKRILFWIAVVELFLITGLISVSYARRSYYQQPGAVTGRAEHGAKLFYGDAQCSVCHSMNGLGGKLAPDLVAARPNTPTIAWLVSKLWNHGPAISERTRPESKIPDLSAQDVADLFAFLASSRVSEPIGRLSSATESLPSAVARFVMALRVKVPVGYTCTRRQGGLHSSDFRGQVVATRFTGE